jgi:predicted SAM-dependent methyltransferase
MPPGIQVDVVTLLAVLEHLPPPEQASLAENCYDVLKPGGRIVVTVPSARVDDLLHVLAKLRLVDGMSMHEHYGFNAADTLRVFAEPRFKVVEYRKFQLGLNNLFVFEKS